uniref:thiol oxidase n=1 Tax=viral metagenome TaxID=1070528 RepID=A0A6C0DEE5_9ZZZZ
MQFVNSRPNNNYNNNTIIMPHTVYYKKQVQNNNIQIISQSTTVSTSVTKLNPQKKMIWGEPTWFLFHTLAEKVKEEYFQTIRYELLNTIVIVCKNLPCPDCANHATEYMKKVDFNSIKTKQDLKLMLFQFHNVVNQKKQFSFFPIEELDTKYSNANLVNIIQSFMFHFQDKHHGIRMIANDLYRSRIADQLKIWFNNNICYFDL